MEALVFEGRLPQRITAAGILLSHLSMVKDIPQDSDIDWDSDSRCSSVARTDSRPQIGTSRFDVDEAETANILISLGNSPSGTPACFTPIQQTVPHSPRSHSQTPSPALCHRSATFTPISQTLTSLILPWVPQTVGVQ